MQKELTNKNILVTGGAGFIGSHLVDRLTSENVNKIIVVDNFFLGKLSNLSDAINKGNVVIYNEDAGDHPAMESIVIKEKIDVVFNLATKALPYSFFNPDGAYMTNVNIASTLLRLLRQGTYETLIHSSSSEVYGTAEFVPMDETHPLKPTTPYAAGKAAADLMIISYYNTFDLDVSILCPFNNYGPRQNEGRFAAIIPLTAKRILNGEQPVIEGDGQQTRDFLFVADTVDAFIRIYNKNVKGKVINVASGVETKIESIVHLIMKCMKYDGDVLWKPARPADVRRHCGDIKLAKSLIGFEPQTSLEQGIQKTLDWYLKKWTEAA